MTSRDMGVSRGQRLWRDTTAELPDLGPRERVLLEEACRAADRLEALDQILSGTCDAWTSIEVSDGGVIKVVINAPLAEARQQQLTLRALLSEIRQSKAGKKSGGETGGSALGELAARIAARREATR